MKKTYSIDGMSCNHCKASVEKAVKNIKGVTSVEVSLKYKNATVEGDFSPEEIKDTINRLGFIFMGEE